MSYEIALGQTHVSIDVQCVDDAGLPIEDLNASNFPTPLVTRGRLEGFYLLLQDLGSVTASWLDGGIISKGNGIYRLDLPDTVGEDAFIGSISGEATGKHLLATQLAVTNRIQPTGSVPVTIIVTDEDDDPLQDVEVRLFQGTVYYPGITDADGEAVVGSPEGTVRVVLSLGGYSFTPVDHVVDIDDEATLTATFQMVVRVVTPPSSPDYTTGTLYTQGATTTIAFKILEAPAEESGQQYDAEFVDATADDHELEIELRKGATYVAKDRGGNETEFEVPADAGDDFEIPSLVGLYT